MWLQRLPRLGIIILLHFPAPIQRPLGDAQHEARLEHERHTAGADLGRRERVRIRRLRVRRRVRAVPAHDIMQRGASRLEARAGLRVVLPVDEAHELGHRVAVVPRRAEGVLGDEPARREDDEVGDGGARVVGGRRQDGEDARVRVVVGDGADRVEAPEVVLVGIVVAVPGDDVEGRVVLPRGEESAGEFGQQRVFVLRVFVEGGNGRLEVPRVREAVRADGAELG